MRWSFSSRRQQTQANALRDAPGPSPWYLRGQSALSTSRGNLTWRDAGRSDARLGQVILADRFSRAFLVADFYCYFYPLHGISHALLWYRVPSEENRSVFSAVQLYLLDLNGIAEIKDVGGACVRTRASRQKAAFEKGEICSVTLPAALASGLNQFVYFLSHFGNCLKFLCLFTLQ